MDDVSGAEDASTKIIGADIVEAAGGKVRNVPYVKGKSTTNIIAKVMKYYS